MSEPQGGAEPPAPPSRPAATPWQPPFPPPRRPQRNWIVPVVWLGFIVLVVIVGVALIEVALAGLRDSYTGAAAPPPNGPVPLELN